MALPSIADHVTLLVMSEKQKALLREEGEKLKCLIFFNFLQIADA